MARSTAGESVLERVVRILQVFDTENVAVSVTDIAERADLPMSTASRLIDDMVELGLLRRDQNRRVRIGFRLWELASRAGPTRGLRDAAMPFIEDLHAIVGHHVQVGVLDGREVLFIERLSSPGAVINVTRIAGRLSLHASSSGLVLLAYSSSAFQEQILRGPLPAYTSQTLTEPSELRAFLAEVRRSGAAVCPGFIHPDATGIAVPIRDRRDAVVATLSVVVPRTERPSVHLPALMAAARGIRREIGRPNFDVPGSTN
ncbi:IclR family transcriptional regulator [Tsukamurella tyrosinosolvens]|uniref:IclR family transcriptional regulator n=1 Tax=Tsukamurella tyrosinosolvens TaxID=57704 RepID=UPI001CE063A5|nr:IclR family transcriptional regulator [Tsukamurella tyrosinosolvens]MCA4997892.1 IclR family transcriptional regulator [Tsukamurella tyrosinosolvens]